MAKRLTSLAVERLRATASRQEIPDGGCPGLYLIVERSGTKSWAVRQRIDGRPVKLALGKYPLLDLTAARDRARRALEVIDRGGDPRREREEQRRAEATRRASTFSVVALEFIERYCKANQPRSWGETKRTFERHLFPAWGELPFDAIRRADLYRVLDGLDAQGIPGAKHHVVAAVSKLFAWAVDREMVQASPFVRLKRPVPAPRQRTLTDAEIRTLWTAAEGVYPFGALVRLLLLTGCRRTELAAMAWDEVDPERGVLVIPRERVKGGKPHVVPLSGLAREIVDGLPRFAEGRFLFSTTGGHKPVSGFSKLKAAFDKRLEAPIDYDLHDLRRTVRTRLSELRVRPDIAERVLGHVQRGISVYYDMWEYLDEKSEALSAWARRLESLIAPAGPDNVVELAGRR
jgi:integrase